jgi:hypothetical protein
MTKVLDPNGILYPRDLTKLKYRYEVRGWGYFPTDMLRYDRAIVVDQVQICTLHNRPLWLYTIMGETKPTKGRWESFMYNLVGEVTRL